MCSSDRQQTSPQSATFEESPAVLNMVPFAAAIAFATPALANSSADPALDQIRAPFELCRSALRGVESNGPARSARPAPDTICFAGRIDRHSMDQLLDLFHKVPAGTPAYFVAVSNGGEVGPALDVAETILQRDVTFIAGPLCASSCANYFFLPAARRVLLENSIVAFHGGMSPGFIGGRERALEKELAKRRPDPEAVADYQRRLAWARPAVPREQAMLRAVGANPRFFEMFDSFAIHPGSKFARDCRLAKRASMFLLSDRVLAENNIEVHINLGPRTADELHALLQALGLAGEICLWI
jgi:hypothetical protein